MRKPLIIPVPARRGMGATGANLSPSDIYQVALNAGFPPSTAVTMVAIALQESSGNPSAYNGVPPDASYGLWQINMIGSLGPQRRAQLGISSNDALYDPATNARAAYMLWGGNDANLNNWTTYTKGLYLASLPLAQSAGAAVDAANAAAGSGATVAAFSGDGGGSAGIGTIDPTTLALLIGAGLFTLVVLS